MSNPNFESKMDPGHVGGGQQAPPPYQGGQYAPVYPTPYPAGGASVTVVTTQGTGQTGPVFQQFISLLGPHPAAMECPNCHQQIVSQTQSESGTLTWLLVGGLCLIGCWLGCCLIPTCVPECQDVLHTCPNCKVFVGRYRRM